MALIEHVKKNGKTAWYVDFRDQHGKRRHEWGGLTRKAAEKREAAITIEVKAGVYQHPKDRKRTERDRAAAVIAQAAAEREAQENAPTYTKAAGAFLTDCAAGIGRVRTAATLAGYAKELDPVLSWWGARRIADTTTAAVDDWTAAMRRADLSTSTIRHRLDRLAQLQKTAVRKGWITAEPCRIERPKMIARSERRATSEPELEKLIGAARKSKDARRLAIILLGADAGLRRGEMPRLRGQDFRLQDFDGGCWGWITVAIRSEKDRSKSGRARQVPILTQRLHDALRALWPGEGKPLLRGIRTAAGLRHVADQIWRTARLPGGAQLHELRHRWITRLLDAGEAPSHVQMWAGHSDLKTTMGYYHGGETPSPRASAALRGDILETNESAAKATAPATLGGAR